MKVSSICKQFIIVWRTVWMYRGACKMVLVHIECQLYSISSASISMIILLPRNYNIHEENGISWPTYSPNFTPCNFFLWRYLKNVVCHQTPQTIAELKQYICTACGTISTDMFARLPGHFCLGQYHISGGYFENVV